jgi:hypothetical protein
MLSLMSRKNELKKLLCSSENSLYKQVQGELKDIALLDKSKMIGKEYALGKTTNPLLESAQAKPGSGQGLSTPQQQAILEKYKLMIQFDAMDDLNQTILRMG